MEDKCEGAEIRTNRIVKNKLTIWIFSLKGNKRKKTEVYPKHPRLKNQKLRRIKLTRQVVFDWDSKPNSENTAKPKNTAATPRTILYTYELKLSRKISPQKQTSMLRGSHGELAARCGFAQKKEEKRSSRVGRAQRPDGADVSDQDVGQTYA